jgi:hypothetical protein
MASNCAKAGWLHVANASTVVPATIALIVVFVKQYWKPALKADFTEFEELEMAMNASSGKIVAIQNTLDGDLLSVPYTDV